MQSPGERLRAVIHEMPDRDLVARHRAEWPALWAAIDAVLADEYDYWFDYWEEAQRVADEK